VIVFDVNETLSDMAPMASRFTEVGASGLLATAWFAAVLRDGFALTAAGGKEAFARLARGALDAVLAGASLNRPAPEAADYILAGFSDLSVHPDVPDGVRLLREGGLRLGPLATDPPMSPAGCWPRRASAANSSTCCRSRTLTPGNPRPPPTPTPPRHARSRSIRCCWWPCTPGTSTAHTRRACAPGG